MYATRDAATTTSTICCDEVDSRKIKALQEKLLNQEQLFDEFCQVDHRQKKRTRSHGTTRQPVVRQARGRTDQNDDPRNS